MPLPPPVTRASRPERTMVDWGTVVVGDCGATGVLTVGLLRSCHTVSTPAISCRSADTARSVLFVLNSTLSLGRGSWGGTICPRFSEIFPARLAESKDTVWDVKFNIAAFQISPNNANMQQLRTVSEQLYSCTGVYNCT